MPTVVVVFPNLKRPCARTLVPENFNQYASLDFCLLSREDACPNQEPSALRIQGLADIYDVATRSTIYYMLLV